MRLTRSQRRAEAENITAPDIHQDETATESPTSIHSPIEGELGRAPLKEIVINEEEIVQEMAPKKKAGKGKGKGRGKKAKKEVEEVEDTQPVEPEVNPEVLEDERKAAASPASEAAEEELRKEPDNKDIPEAPVEDDVHAPPPSRAVRRTRRQLAKAEPVPEEPTPAPEPVSIEEPEMNTPSDEEMPDEPVAEEALDEEPAVEEPVEEASPAREESTPEVEEMEVQESVKSPQNIKQNLSPIKTIQDEDVSSRSVSQSPSRKTPRAEDSIEAFDALEEAMDEINKALPSLTPGKTRATPRVKVNGHTPNTSESSIDAPVGAPKVSRTPRAPKSAKENVPPKSAKKSTVSTTIKTSLSRSQSTKASATARPKPQATGEVVDYLASKRRPVSVSFPTPPPAAKSTKAPTKATFTLPGEAVAAKLKAAREARLAKEAEEEEKAAKKKPVVKARPAPKPTAGPVIKQTAASKAREAAINGTAPEPKPLQRTASVSISTSNKRHSSAMSPRRPTSYHAHTSSKDMPGVTIPPPAPANSTSTATAAKPRVPSSLITSQNANRPRVPSATVVPASSKTAISAAEVAAQKQKGREVFNRDRHEKEEREREKREKEEAAKKARAEAAERGRIASREWAEKQKKKLEERKAAVAAGGSA